MPHLRPALHEPVRDMREYFALHRAKREESPASGCATGDSDDSRSGDGCATSSGFEDVLYNLYHI
jgi:hypothetical protein